MPSVAAVSPLATSDRLVVDMTTHELLSVLIGGASEAAVAVAARLIDAGDGLVASGQPDAIAERTGVSPDDARLLVAAVELARRATAPIYPAALKGPADVAAIAQRELRGRRRERLLAIVCDAATRPVRNVVIADGVVDRCPVPTREIISAVLRYDGRGFALAHNHGVGSAEPSEADIDATCALASAARVVGLRFLGHVVVGHDGWQEVPMPIRIPR